MRLCLNPRCQRPSDPANEPNLKCRHCGSDLILNSGYTVSRLLSNDSGFGDIYEAYPVGEHKLLPKILKVLKAQLSHQPKAVELFQQEAHVLQQLNDPGIPKVEPDGYFVYFPRDAQEPLHCLIMEKINGETLAQYLEQQGGGGIPEMQAVDWLQQIVRILNRVHEQAYFHRDIKPANIMRRPNGKLVLIDFGTAREMTGTYLAKMAANHGVTRLTSAGYTPPEQEKGHSLPQSDFYALGRTFVYLLTGKNPIDPDLYNPHTDDLNWRPYAPQISPEFADLLDHLMEPKAMHRPANGTMILEKLEAIAHKLSAQPAAQSIPPTLLIPGAPTPQVHSLSLQLFQFEVITLTDRGQVKSCQGGEAECFEEELGKGVSLTLVKIPSGVFIMGSPDTEISQSPDETPQRAASVPEFFMGKYPITQAQWQVIMGSNPSAFKGENYPVETVSWNDCQAFCQRLSLITGHSYRLPSETEWEYACRAGTNTPFHFGKTLTPDFANYNGTHTYGYGSTGTYRQSTTSVGRFPPNAFGLFDMHGNVWEWCQDGWHDNYVGAPVDGGAWTTGGQSNRKILRGGSWFYNPWHCRSANRFKLLPIGKYNTNGLRVVMEP